MSDDRKQVDSQEPRGADAKVRGALGTPPLEARVRVPEDGADSSHPAAESQDDRIGPVAAAIRALDLVRQQGEDIPAAETARMVRDARRCWKDAHQANVHEHSALMEHYYRNATGPLTIDYFLDTSAATGRRADEEYVEFLRLLDPFREQLLSQARCRLWSISRLRARDLAFLLLLVLRSPDKTLAIPISHGVPDARFHTYGANTQRLQNSDLRRLFMFQGGPMPGIPQNDLCEGSCYHLDRVPDWAAITKGKIFHTTTSDYLLTAHLFDLATHWARNGGTLPKDFSLFSRSAVPYWYPKNLDGTARREPFDVRWTATDGTWN